MPLANAPAAFTARLEQLSNTLLSRSPNTPEFAAAAAHYLGVLDGLVNSPEHSDTPLADTVSEPIRAALLQACRVEGTGTNARPSSIGGRTGAPSRALLADELLPRALRNWWLWSAEEKAALEAVAAEPQTRSTVPLPPPPPQPAATYRSFAAAAPASLGKRPVPTYRTLGAAATGDAMSSQGSQGSESQPSQSQPPPLPPSHGSGGKLELVLDLDHTLVHACELHSDALPPSDAHTFSLRPHLGAPEARYKLKLRDGVRAFLKEARSFCTLHVYTMGSQSYTRQVLSLIDPALTFDGQILCRRDGDDAPFEKSVAHLVQNDKSLTDEASRNAMRDRMIVIDDRDEVWDVRSRPHVVLVPQFHAWHDDGTPSSRSADQVPDSTLVDVLHILRQVSSDLRSGADSVPALLRQRQRSILSGCVLVFSGGLLRDAHKPELSKSWRMAEALGARCEVFFDVRTVTHVVSGQPDTNSVHKAIANNLHAVSNQWLQDSYMRWAKQEEGLYAIGASAAAPPTEGGAPTYRSLAAPPPPAATAAPGPATILPPLAAESIEERVSRACKLVRKFLLPEEKYNASQRSAAIRFLVHPESKEEAQKLLDAFEGNNGKDPAAAKEALDQLTQLVGKEALQGLIDSLRQGADDHGGWRGAAP